MTRDPTTDYNEQYWDGLLAKPAPSARRHRLPEGECSYCDRNRTDTMMPFHDASLRCESGRHSHCTCDVCY